MNVALVEVVARALAKADWCIEWDDMSDSGKGRFVEFSTSALAAIEAAGWVVAPATATDAMIAAAKGNNYEWPASCYDVMIDARPKVVTP